MTASPLPPPRTRSLVSVWVSLGVCLSIVVGAEIAFRQSALYGELAAESQYVAKATALSENEARADIAITGDSRTLHGVNPFTVEDAFRTERGEKLVVYNAGLSGAPPMTQLAMIRRLLTAPKKPRLVVMCLSPYMFSSQIFRRTARESLTTIYRIRDLGAAFRAGAAAEDLATIALSNLLESYRYRPRLLSLLAGGKVKPKAPIGRQGFIENGEGDPTSQTSRGKSRGLGYRKEMWRPNAHFGNEHQGYFEEALRELSAAGVKTLVLSTQSASQIDLAYGPNSIYDEHMQWVRSVTARAGVPFIDVKNNPAVKDEDFVDGDHLGGNGAARFSAWLAHEHLIPALGGRSPDRPKDCRTLFDFEDPALLGWSREGLALTAPIADQSKRMMKPSLGYTGHRFLTTFASPAGDSATGMATSGAVTVASPELRLRVAGGRSATVRIALVVDGAEVLSASGQGDETFRDVVWNTQPFVGKTAVFRITDAGVSRGDHLQVDDIATCP